MPADLRSRAGRAPGMPCGKPIGVVRDMSVVRKFTGNRLPVGHAARRARRYSWCSPPRIGVAITSVCRGRR